MSELTPCNYCTLRRIKARAKKKDQRVTTTPAKNSRGGIDILMYPRHLGAKDARADRKKYKVAWLMKITNKCCC